MKKDVSIMKIVEKFGVLFLRIKRKKSLPLQTAMEENYILGFGMTERL